MRMRMLLIVSLAMLLAPNALWAMEATGPLGERIIRRGEAQPVGETDMRIFVLRYYPAEELAEIIRAVTPRNEATVVQDERENRIIVTASPTRMQQIEDLISALDTARTRREQGLQMMCRVYMLELPPQGPNLRPFSVTVESIEQLPVTEFTAATADPQLQVDSFHQADELAPSGHIVFTIKGRAGSKEAIHRMLQRIPSTLMNELQWQEDAFSTSVPAAQLAQMPASVQQHVRKFLGEGVQTVGYWFGNLSVPGEVRAPLGMWEFVLNADPDQNDELRLEVQAMQESPGGGRIILSNSVRGKVGKPVIIGYNRDRGGTRTMGAMVIVPEVDNTQVRN